VVPFTRGRERSRDPQSIVREVIDLRDQDFKEVILLGQNVNSYLWFGGGPKKEYKKLTPLEQETSVDFANLLEMVALAAPKMRIRYSTSHPRDITEDVVLTMAKHPNICNYIHLPAQSGNSRVLDAMSRNYTREWYLSKITMIRDIIPNCGISCDIIAGFCTETEEEHTDTLTLIEEAQFDFSYMYMYSERPGTPAAKKFTDDIPEDLKKRRLQDIIRVQNEVSKTKNNNRIGQVYSVLIEGDSKKSPNDWVGRSDENVVVVFPKEQFEKGMYVDVQIERATTTTLIGKGLNQSIPF
jgi:tRNA-2-methylthio-N6-dimethylallyladenosine synthase